MTVTLRTFRPGDIIYPKQAGASRLQVQDPILTSQGKLRMVRIDSPTRSEATAWWETPDDLPRGYGYEAVS